MLLCQLIRLTDEAILGDLQRITQLIWSNAKYKLINQTEEFLYVWFIENRDEYFYSYIH